MRAVQLGNCRNVKFLLADKEICHEHNSHFMVHRDVMALFQLYSSGLSTQDRQTDRQTLNTFHSILLFIFEFILLVFLSIMQMSERYCAMTEWQLYIDNHWFLFIHNILIAVPFFVYRIYSQAVTLFEIKFRISIQKVHLIAWINWICAWMGEPKGNCRNA